MGRLRYRLGWTLAKNFLELRSVLLVIQKDMDPIYSCSRDHNVVPTRHLCPSLTRPYTTVAMTFTVAHMSTGADCHRSRLAWLKVWSSLQTSYKAAPLATLCVLSACAQARPSFPQATTVPIACLRVWTRSAQENVSTVQGCLFQGSKLLSLPYTKI